MPLPERNWRKALQMFSCALPASADTALSLLAEAEAEGLDRAQALEARAALLGWVAHYAAPEHKIRLFTNAIDFARQAVRAEPRSAIAQMTLGFLLLERAEVTQGQHPTGRNDISEAALALATAADRCETAMRQAPLQQMETTDAAENEGAATSDSAAGNDGTADVDGFGYPRWSDLFDCRMERAYLARGVSKAQWAREMRATIAWRCRSLLSDLAGANAQQEEAFRQAQSAVMDLPQEAEALLRLARCEAVTGQLELSAHHYQRRTGNHALRLRRLARTGRCSGRARTTRCGPNFRAGTPARSQRNSHFCRHTPRADGSDRVVSRK